MGKDYQKIKAIAMGFVLIGRLKNSMMKVAIIRTLNRLVSIPYHSNFQVLAVIGNDDKTYSSFRKINKFYCFTAFKFANLTAVFNNFRTFS